MMPPFGLLPVRRHSSVTASHWNRYGHLLSEAEDELSGRLDDLIPKPQKLFADKERSRPAASLRPGLVLDSSFKSKGTGPTREYGSGASWNRTSDLSIISAAL